MDTTPKLRPGCKQITIEHKSGERITFEMYCPTEDVTPKIGDKYKPVGNRRTYKIVKIT